MLDERQRLLLRLPPPPVGDDPASDADCAAVEEARLDALGAIEALRKAGETGALFGASAGEARADLLRGLLDEAARADGTVASGYLVQLLSQLRAAAEGEAGMERRASSAASAAPPVDGPRLFAAYVALKCFLIDVALHTRDKAARARAEASYQAVVARMKELLLSVKGLLRHETRDADRDLCDPAKRVHVRRKFVDLEVLD